jgi:hypothetical protein
MGKGGGEGSAGPYRALGGQREGDIRVGSGMHYRARRRAWAPAKRPALVDVCARRENGGGHAARTHGRHATRGQLPVNNVQQV